jgi:glycine/D-amino acid oxidase-like deaminating enzyme
MNLKDIFSSAYDETSYWWRDWRPHDDEHTDVPKRADVAIIGGGYTGLTCAMELRRHGRDVVVLEAGLPGVGASTLSGGGISAGMSIGKKPSGRSQPLDALGSPHSEQAMLAEAVHAYAVFEQLLEDHGIECDYQQCGRVVGASTAAHLGTWTSRIEKLNRSLGAGARVLSSVEMKAELDSSYYAGGILIERTGLIQPALYYAGLLSAARRLGVLFCSNAKATLIAQCETGFRVATERGETTARRVVLATNGLTGDLVPSLRRRVVPVISHQIATEELPRGLAQKLIPNARSIVETRRVSPYYRLSPDGRRLLWGGRARFYQMSRRESARVLRDQMVARLPQLADVRIEHSWGGPVALTLDFVPHIGQIDGVDYALGCNGNGIVMMSYLGQRLGAAIAAGDNPRATAFGASLPSHLLYRRNPWFMPILGSYYQVRDAIDRYRQG